MQLGTRWNVGAQPPAALPTTMTQAVSQVETELADVDTSQWRWTLTWLEGRPVAELDDGTTIRLDAQGVAVVTPPADD